MEHRISQTRERGTILLVVVFIATAIAALAALGSGRVVAETRYQRTVEDETRATNLAFANLHRALNVVNNSAYDDQNHNLALQRAIAGTYGGTAGGQTASGEEWLRDPTGVLHGFIEGTDVRVYRGKDYIKRLQKIKGETVSTEIDPGDLSQNFFVIEAAGRSGDATRLVSALVRENEPFSSFVFFQNQHTLGVSGTPNGLIHSNDRLAFYFPNGNYEDPVSAVNGFDYTAGATTANTTIADGNPDAARIALDAVDFEELRGKSGLFRGTPGLDAEISLRSNGDVVIKQYTKPRYDWVFGSQTIQVLVGYEERTTTQQQQIQVGTTQESRTRSVITGYTTESYQTTVPVYETRQVTQTRQVPVYELQNVTKTRQVPVYETRLVTRYRSVRVFVPYDTGGDADGGTAVGGGGSGTAGEYVWVQEPYQVQEQVLTGYNTETYVVQENVIVGYTTETYTVNQQVQVGTQTVTQTRQVPVYGTETYFVDVPVYQTQDVQVTEQVPLYESQTQQTQTWTYFAPQFVDSTTVNVRGSGGTVFIDGRVTKLSGSLNGHLTIVGNEKVRVTGNIKYVDDSGRSAMLNGGDYTKPYTRNPAYTGTSVLGILARDDLLLTNGLPSQAEINATLMSVEGRVGIDGFAIASDGTPVKNYQAYMTDAEKLQEQAYDQTSYKTRTFTKDSLRRIGGIISNDRILETYIKPRSDGTSYVDAGFKRGSMKFDINLIFNPPPNFVEVPRPVLTYYAPIFFVRNNEG